MPHLKAQAPKVGPVAKPTKPVKVKPVKVAKVKAPKVVKVKAPKATKAPSVAKKTKVKYPDFTIVARPDRGGFEGWYGGKAEAFRDNVEKVHSFFQKKYQQTGQVLP
jgi:hypothetical protein